MSPRLIGLLTSLALVAAPLPARAAELQVIVFPGDFNWPIWAAQGRFLPARGARGEAYADALLHVLGVAERGCLLELVIVSTTLLDK